MLLLGLLGVLLASPAPALAKPPSFTHWVAGQLLREERDVNRAARACATASGGDDVRFGACIVASQRVELRADALEWDKQAAMIARGQSAPCRSAIHDYSDALVAHQKALLAYMDSHPRVASTRLVHDLRREPFATLKATTRASLFRAVRVCG
jgi:hypothetical protein